MSFNNPRFIDNIDVISEDGEMSERYEIQINEESIMIMDTY